METIIIDPPANATAAPKKKSRCQRRNHKIKQEKKNKQKQNDNELERLRLAQKNWEAEQDRRRDVARQVDETNTKTRIQRIQEVLRVVGDFEEPLRQPALFDRRARPPAFAVD